MTWLDGIPHRIRSLFLPPEAHSLRQKTYNCDHYSGTSILDDRVCFFISYVPNVARTAPETAIFYADLADDSESEQHEVHMKHIAQLSNLMPLVELLPRGGSTSALFVSVTLDYENYFLTLRTHSHDGSVLLQQTTRARAVYGRLVISGETVALCISSGRPPQVPSGRFLVAFNSEHAQLQDSIPENAEFADYELVPDQIVAWDLRENQLKTVVIPQPEDVPMLHCGVFELVSPDIVALAGAAVGPVCDFIAGLLRCFSISEKPGYERTFIEVPTSDACNVSTKVGRSGSSLKSDIFTHIGHELSVYRRELLTGQIKSRPSTVWRCSLHSVKDHRDSHRSVEVGSTANPSIAGNRVLMRGTLNSYRMQRDPPLMILDFDSVRVKRLLDLDQGGRKLLEAGLQNVDAHVNVITRRYHYLNNSQKDEEFPPPPSVRALPRRSAMAPYPDFRPPEWTAHLRELYQRDKERFEGSRDYPSLEYDEAPEAHRNQDLFGFSASLLKLPEGIDLDAVALTSSGLVCCSDDDFMFGERKTWLVFDFKE